VDRFSFTSISSSNCCVSCYLVCMHVRKDTLSFEATVQKLMPHWTRAKLLSHLRHCVQGDELIVSDTGDIASCIERNFATAAILPQQQPRSPRNSNKPLNNTQLCTLIPKHHVNTRGSAHVAKLRHESTSYRVFWWLV
jgi:hypothetical protein